MRRSRACRIRGRRSRRCSPEEKIVKKTVLGFVLVALAVTAWAQTYPNRAVRIIVPAGTGGPDNVPPLGGGPLGGEPRPPLVIQKSPRPQRILGAGAGPQIPPPR